MKKHYISFILLIFFIAIIKSNINAEEKGLLEDFTSDVISYKVDQLNTNIAKYYSSKDDLYAFCIEPDQVFARLSKKYIKSSYQNEHKNEVAKLINAFNILVKSKKEVNEINNLYIATQLQIWNEIFNNNFTIQGNDATYYGLQEITNYLKNNTNIRKIEVNDLNTCNYFEINYIDNEQINKNDYFIDSKEVEQIDGKNDSLAFKFINFDNNPINIKIKPKVTYDEKLNNVLYLYKNESYQDLIILKGELPIDYQINDFKVSYKTGDLLINKYDEEGNVVLDKIGLQIYNCDDELVKDLNNNDWYIEDGILKINNYLPEGDYYLKELHHDNYKDNPNPILFNINSENECKIKLINEKVDFNLEFKKVDQDNNLLNGAEFKIYDLYKNDENIIFINTNVDINLYHLFNISDKYSIKISERYEKYFRNGILNTNELGFFKYDIFLNDDFVSEGKIYVSNNKELTNGTYKYLNVKQIDSLLSNSLNRFTVKKNKKYLLCESEPALGYEYINEPCVIIDTSKYNNDLIIKNRKRYITLHLKKVDSIKNIPLNGALFKVGYFDNEGKQHNEVYITGEKSNDQLIDGGFIVSNIPYDKPIVIEEIKAPNGYFKDDNVYTIYPNIEYSDITFTNYRPNTAILLPGYRIVSTCVE